MVNSFRSYLIPRILTLQNEILQEANSINFEASEYSIRGLVAFFRPRLVSGLRRVQATFASPTRLQEGSLQEARLAIGAKAVFAGCSWQEACLS